MSLRKRQGETVYEVYPMELQRIQIGSQRTFDRLTRGRSWIILDLELPPDTTYYFYMTAESGDAIQYSLTIQAPEEGAAQR